jgi:hypothetical protein
MRLRHEMTRRMNLKLCVAALCLASLAMPVAGQQTPVAPNAVHKATTPPAAKQAPSSTAPAAKAQTTASQPQTAAPTPAAPKTNVSNAGNSKPQVSKPASTTATTAKPTNPTATGPKTAAVAAKPKPALGGNAPAGPAASSAAKSPSVKPVKAVRADVPTSATGPVIQPIAVRENIVRRDPFAPLIGKEISGGGSPLNLPPGKPGLLISSLRINGIVNGPNGMIAVVSNTQDRVYFLREGDRLYDGQVEHITMDGISFHQAGKDPFGNAVEREVAKRLNSTPGEQQ